jgi:hypothetical protein
MQVQIPFIFKYYGKLKFLSSCVVITLTSLTQQFSLLLIFVVNKIVFPFVLFTIFPFVIVVFQFPKDFHFFKAS